MNIWKVDRLALGHSWELKDAATGKYGRVLIGYDSGRVGWYASARYDVGRGLQRGEYYSYDGSEAGVQKCITWVGRLLSGTSLPGIDFRPSLHQLLNQTQMVRPRSVRLVAPRAGTEPY